MTFYLAIFGFILLVIFYIIARAASPNTSVKRIFKLLSIIVGLGTVISNIATIYITYAATNTEPAVSAIFGIISIFGLLISLIFTIIAMKLKIS